MNNYQLPAYKSKDFEQNYQRLVASALRTAPVEPRLVPPRPKYRGWGWLAYNRGGK
jgi:hypothetical protein